MLELQPTIQFRQPSLEIPINSIINNFINVIVLMKTKPHRGDWFLILVLGLVLVAGAFHGKKIVKNIYEFSLSKSCINLLFGLQVCKPMKLQRTRKGAEILGIEALILFLKYNMYSIFTTFSIFFFINYNKRQRIFLYKKIIILYGKSHEHYHRFHLLCFVP